MRQGGRSFCAWPAGAVVFFSLGTYFSNTAVHSVLLADRVFCTGLRLGDCLGGDSSSTTSGGGLCAKTCRTVMPPNRLLSVQEEHFSSWSIEFKRSSHEDIVEFVDSRELSVLSRVSPSRCTSGMVAVSVFVAKKLSVKQLFPTAARLLSSTSSTSSSLSSLAVTSFLRKVVK